MRWHLKQAAAWLNHGGVIAYPTESVYGLGCDPLNQAAVNRLLQIKQRHPSKGLILISDNVDRIAAYLEPLSEYQRKTLTTPHPTPVTWLVSTQDWVPDWLTGQHDTLAIRITSHPLAAALCQLADMPIVSTSANLAGRRPARNAIQVHRQFDDQLDYILTGQTGPATRPSMIRDLKTDRVIRQ